MLNWIKLPLQYVLFRINPLGSLEGESSALEGEWKGQRLRVRRGRGGKAQRMIMGPAFLELKLHIKKAWGLERKVK